MGGGLQWGPLYNICCRHLNWGGGEIWRKTWVWGRELWGTQTSSFVLPFRPLQYQPRCLSQLLSALGKKLLLASTAIFALLPFITLPPTPQKTVKVPPPHFTTHEWNGHLDFNSGLHAVLFLAVG